MSEFADLSSLQTPREYTGQIGSRDGGVKLADVLTMLDDEDESKIFIVRRISKLGHNANAALADFFNRFGLVRRIILLPSRGRGDSRTRPASMGFIVMEHTLDCARICAVNGYSVGHVDIQVQKFTRNERVQVSDGLTVTNAYVPASRMSPPRQLVDVSETRTLSTAELELLAKAVIDTLEI